MTVLPVIYQDFDGEESEYAHMVADNAIASWSELDLSGINSDLSDLGPDLDLDLLGIEHFTLDMAERDLPSLDEEEHMRTIKLSYTPDIYDHVMLQMDRLCDKHGIDDHSQLIAHLLDINL